MQEPRMSLHVGDVIDLGAGEAFVLKAIQPDRVQFSSLFEPSKTTFLCRAQFENYVEPYWRRIISSDGEVQVKGE